MSAGLILWVYIVFFILEYSWTTLLSVLNILHTDKQSGSVPGFAQEFISRDQFKKSIQYTIVKEKFGIISGTIGSAFLFAIVTSGFLGIMDRLIGGLRIGTYTHGVLYILLLSVIFKLISLPFSLYAVFRIEAQFGFNRTTPAVFFIDLVKGLVLSFVLFVPILYILFFFMDRTGGLWWLYAFGIFTLFQFFIMLIYPTLIAPLFNKFSPLEPGTLSDRINTLAEKLGFKTKGIFVMDGSKRSSHSNAYFTGLGKSKRIVFYDTLLKTCNEDEILGILAHEIGHEKKQHVKKMLFISLAGSLAGFFIISMILKTPPFFNAFGFDAPAYHAVLVIILFCSGPFTFYLTPIASILSRRHEYEADRFAVSATGDPASFRNALLVLHKENLGNLVPHPLYSFYHYSHPTIAERIRAIEKITQQT